MLIRLGLVVVAIVVVGLLLMGVGLGTGMMRFDSKGVEFGREDQTPDLGAPKPTVVSADELLRRQASQGVPLAPSVAIATPTRAPVPAHNVAKVAISPSRQRAGGAAAVASASDARTASAILVADPVISQTGAIRVLMPAVRVDAGSNAAVRDARGNEWQADQNFDHGQIVDRGPILITNTDFPELYRTERYDMAEWHKDLPNGRYRVSLHFAETCPYINGPGQRVFHLSVQGNEVRDFDVFKEAGGRQKALVKTFHVTVADGKLAIRFGKTDKNAPEINGIEVVEEK
ncbi:MAG TPA: malectin [Tepidisphaeraceae bacterium]|nr:malectin [Tepidisphaeraceae bacterium]